MEFALTDRLRAALELVSGDATELSHLRRADAHSITLEHVQLLSSLLRRRQEPAPHVWVRWTAPTPATGDRAQATQPKPQRKKRSPRWAGSSDPMPDDPPKTARSEGYRHDPTAFPSLPQAGPRYGWQLPLKPPDLCAAAADAAVSVSEFRRVSRTQSTENLIGRAYDGQICVCTQLKARRLVCPGVNGWSVLCTSVESSKHQWMGCVRCRNPCRVLSATHIPYA